MVEGREGYFAEDEVKPKKTTEIKLATEQGSSPNETGKTYESERYQRGDLMKPPRSKLRGITRKGIVCETPRFLTLFPLQGNLEASSEESPD